MAESVVAPVAARRSLDIAVGAGAGVSINLLSSLVEGQAVRIGALVAVIAAAAVMSQTVRGGWLSNRAGPGYCAPVVRWCGWAAMGLLMGVSLAVVLGRMAPAEGLLAVGSWWVAASLVLALQPSARVSPMAKSAALAGLPFCAPIGATAVAWCLKGSLVAGAIALALAAVVVCAVAGMVSERMRWVALAVRGFAAVLLATDIWLGSAGEVTAATAGAALALAILVGSWLPQGVVTHRGRVAVNLRVGLLVVGVGFGVSAALAWRAGRTVDAASAGSVAVAGGLLWLGYEFRNRRVLFSGLIGIGLVQLPLGGLYLRRGEVDDSLVPITTGFVAVATVVSARLRSGDWLAVVCAVPGLTLMASSAWRLGVQDVAQRAAVAAVSILLLTTAAVAAMRPRLPGLRAWWHEVSRPAVPGSLCDEPARASHGPIQSVGAARDFRRPRLLFHPTSPLPERGQRRRRWRQHRRPKVEASRAMRAGRVMGWLRNRVEELRRRSRARRIG